jgi:hypothetical protein
MSFSFESVSEEASNSIMRHEIRISANEECAAISLFGKKLRF